jgi:hypothetical protein
MSELQGPRIPGEERSGSRRPLGWIIGGLLALLLLALLIPFACQALGEGSDSQGQGPGTQEKMAPGMQVALRTPTPRAPERLPKPSPRRAMARKPVKKVRQGRMVLLPEALQRRTVQRLLTNKVR